MSENVTERVICAAIHWDDGVARENLPVNLKTGYCVGGWRHGNCWNSIYGFFSLEEWLKHEHVMGFLTSTGRFVDREEGFKVAVKAGQVEDRPMTEERKKRLEWLGLPLDTKEQLISEDLY